MTIFIPAWPRLHLGEDNMPPLALKAVDSIVIRKSHRTRQIPMGSPLSEMDPNDAFSCSAGKDIEATPILFPDQDIQTEQVEDSDAKHVSCIPGELLKGGSAVYTDYKIVTESVEGEGVAVIHLRAPSRASLTTQLPPPDLIVTTPAPQAEAEAHAASAAAAITPPASPFSARAAFKRSRCSSSSNTTTPSSSSSSSKVRSATSKGKKLAKVAGRKLASFFQNVSEGLSESSYAVASTSTMLALWPCPLPPSAYTTLYYSHHGYDHQRGPY